MSLKDDLQEIQGIGPAKAEKILALVGDGELDPKIQKALKRAKDRNDRGAAVWLRRYQE